MLKPQIVALVPGDDWEEELTVLKEDGSGANYSDWTIITANIVWGKGEIDIDVDTTQAAIGVFGIKAANAVTGPLPYGPGSTLLIRGRSAQGKVETIYYAMVDGVHVRAVNTLSVTHVGTQGPRGSMLLPVDTTAELVAGFGYDGDHAIVRTTGAEWLKTASVWAATGKNYWPFLEDVADQVAAAAGSAGTAAAAAASALASKNDAGVSETNAANSAAAALASKNAAGVSETNAANSAAAALASKNAAGVSETNAANSAAAALASKNAAGVSEANAAASAAAAIVAKMNWRGAYSGATAYAAKDVVSYGGSSWVAKIATTGNAPPALPATSNTWWELSTQKGDVYEEYAISVQKAANIDLGTYYADRSTSANCTLTKFYGEVITGDVGAQVDVYLAVNGAMIYGPVTATLGAPVDVTGLALVVGAGSKVSFALTSMSGNVTEFFAKAYGATS